MKKLKKELEFKQKKAGSNTILVLVACFIFLSVVRIFVANRLVDFSKKAYDLNLIEGRLQSENQELDVVLSKKSSLSYITERAKDLGFTESPKVVFAKNNPAVAAKLP